MSPLVVFVVERKIEISVFALQLKTSSGYGDADAVKLFAFFSLFHEFSVF
jgi:hypothetical protein